MDGNKKIKGIVFVGIIALALTACKIQLPGYVGLYVDNFISVTDTTDSGVTPMNMEDTAMAHVADTTVVTEAELPGFLNPNEEIFKTSSDSVYQHEVEKLRKAMNDSVQLLRYQKYELQKQPVSPVTGFKETAKLPVVESRQTDTMTSQLIKARDEQIKKLQNRLNVMQNPAARTPRPTYIPREMAQGDPLRQTDQLTLQQFQAQNDTIKFLRSQLRNPQLQAHKSDSGYIENKSKEMQPAKELIAKQKPSDIQAIKDTLQLHKTRVTSIVEPSLPGKKTPALAMQDEKDVPYKAKPDTALIIAFYERGEIKPFEQASVLKQIKELSSNKNVTKITLSGYTDRSGNAKINKQITNKRLNYLTEKISLWIPEEKIFFQNFGDVFASDTMVSDERRIEIKIYAKQR